MYDYASDGEEDTQQLCEAEVAGDVGTTLLQSKLSIEKILLR